MMPNSFLPGTAERHLRTIVFVITLAGLLAATAGDTLAAEPKKASSAVTVSDQKLTFDPKTCTTGKGSVSWALGSFSVTIRGHEKDDCVFDYRWEVEGAGNYVVHRIRVPLDSGPVVIKAMNPPGPSPEHHWSYIYTSFTKAQAQLIAQYSHGWAELLVEGTDGFVAFQDVKTATAERLVAGDKATLRFELFANDKFEPTAKQPAPTTTVTVVVGDKKNPKWLEVVSADMAVGERRRIKLPIKIAQQAKDWFPAARDKETLYLEMELLSVERFKNPSPASRDAPAPRKARPR